MTRRLGKLQLSVNEARLVWLSRSWVSASLAIISSTICPWETREFLLGQG
jgi:hypothetical protein